MQLESARRVPSDRRTTCNVWQRCAPSHSPTLLPPPSHSPTLPCRSMAKSSRQQKPLHPQLPFVEVLGADLKAMLSDPDEGRQELRKLLHEHSLIVFRDAELSPRENVQLNQLAGYHATETHPLGILGGWNAKQTGLANLPQIPEVMCQGNALLKDHHGIASLQLKQLLSFDDEGFHADGMHNMQDRLPVLTSMHCLKAPLAGGETHFACSRLALSRLDPELRELCRRLTVHYAYDESGGSPIMRDGIVREGFQPVAPSCGSAAAAMIVRTAHPLVRNVDGEESLYISCARVERMEAQADERRGLPAVHLGTAESFAFVRRLLGEMTQPPLVSCRRGKPEQPRRASGLCSAPLTPCHCHRTTIFRAALFAQMAGGRPRDLGQPPPPPRAVQGRHLRR